MRPFPVMSGLQSLREPPEYRDPRQFPMRPRGLRIVGGGGRWAEGASVATAPQATSAWTRGWCSGEWGHDGDLRTSPQTAAWSRVLRVDSVPRAVPSVGSPVAACSLGSPWGPPLTRSGSRFSPREGDTQRVQATGSLLAAVGREGHPRSQGFSRGRCSWPGAG